MTAKYQNYWQRLLQEEAEAKAAGGESPLFAQTDAPASPAAPAPPVGGFTYDISLLPEPAPIYSPRLGYDVESLPEPLAGPGSQGYRDGDIVVNGRKSSSYPARTVLAPQDCVTRRVGWQNPQDHGAGYGYRAYCDFTDGDGGIVVGHMEPGSIPKSGTLVRGNAPMGRYDNPSNGHTTGAHLHRGQYDRTGRLIPPDLPSPFPHGGRRTSGFRPRWGKLHEGEDWVE